jgi:hypothetical protein
VYDNVRALRCFIKCAGFNHTEALALHFASLTWSYNRGYNLKIYRLFNHSCWKPERLKNSRAFSSTQCRLDFLLQEEASFFSAYFYVKEKQLERKSYNFFYETAVRVVRQWRFIWFQSLMVNMYLIYTGSTTSKNTVYGFAFFFVSNKSDDTRVMRVAPRG